MKLAELEVARVSVLELRVSGSPKSFSTLKAQGQGPHYGLRVSVSVPKKKNPRVLIGRSAALWGTEKLSLGVAGKTETLSLRVAGSHYTLWALNEKLFSIVPNLTLCSKCRP